MRRFFSAVLAARADWLSDPFFCSPSGRPLGRFVGVRAWWFALSGGFRWYL